MKLQAAAENDDSSDFSEDEGLGLQNGIGADITKDDKGNVIKQKNEKQGEAMSALGAKDRQGLSNTDGAIKVGCSLK